MIFPLSLLPSPLPSPFKGTEGSGTSGDATALVPMCTDIVAKNYEAAANHCTIAHCEQNAYITICMQV